MKKISIVVPMYNEEEGISLFLDVLYRNIEPLNKKYNFEVVLVNDGSKDKTYDLQLKAMEEHDNIVVVNLSRNFGHEGALSAGLNVASGDAVIPMDADLQDPPELIKDLLSKYEEGYDVVNAKRKCRKTDSFFKRNTANLYYKLIAKLSGKVKIEQNVGQYRLFSRRVLDAINALPEKVRVLRTEVPFVGFKTTSVEYDRQERVAGETHYNIKSMSKLASDSIITTTTSPIKISLFISIGLLLLAILSGVVELILFICTCNNVLPINSLTYWFWLVINIILLISSIVVGVCYMNGLYHSAALVEMQNRPSFIIESVKRK